MNRMCIVHRNTESMSNIDDSTHWWSCGKGLGCQDDLDLTAVDFRKDEVSRATGACTWPLSMKAKYERKAIAVLTLEPSRQFCIFVF